MSTSGDSISTLAGPAGVGALCLLGLFLFLDGRAPDLFPTFEQYAKTASWSIVAAVPVLTVSYVLGLSIMIASERAISRVVGFSQKSEVGDLALIGIAGLAKDSPASIFYAEARRNGAVLAGGALALLVLSSGALSETSNLPNLRSTVIIATLLTVFLAVLAAYLAVQESHRAHAIAQSLRSAAPRPDAAS
jgi:hypothetical protein